MVTREDGRRLRALIPSNLSSYTLMGTEFKCFLPLSLGGGLDVELTCQPTAVHPDHGGGIMPSPQALLRLTVKSTAALKTDV
ncbi:unnamed protein product [Arctogadus glacialis]